MSETPATQMLRRAGMSFSEHVCDHVEHGGTAESPRQLGVDEHADVNTVMQHRKGDRLIVFMCGGRQVSAKKLAREFGSKSFAAWPPEAAERASGHGVGGTSPFWTRQSMPVHGESTIVCLDRICINGGRCGDLDGIAPRVLTEPFGAMPVSCALWAHQPSSRPRTGLIRNPRRLTTLFALQRELDSC